MTPIDLPNGKLILLFMLRQVAGISSGDLQAWALESLYLDYFTFAQAKEELIRDHLLSEAVRKGETRRNASGHPLALCDITPEGEVVLDRLLPSIPVGIQTYLRQTAGSWGRKARTESSVLASYDPDGNGAFCVRLSYLDPVNGSAVLTLPAPDEKSAKTMCRKWKESTSGIYTSLLRSLLDTDKT